MLKENRLRSPRRPRMGPSREIEVLSCIVQKVTVWGWYRLFKSGERYWNLATIVQGAKKIGKCLAVMLNGRKWPAR